MPVLTRRPDGAYERAYLPTRQNDLRFLAQLLNAQGCQRFCCSCSTSMASSICGDQGGAVTA